ncbi:MAG: AraC family transcriptional regulator [Phocaeicola plebeius]
MTRIKEGFKGQRMLSLPEDILRKYSQMPLVRPLYIRKLGYFPKVQYHYVQKDKGVDYCMLIYCVAGRGWYQLDGKAEQMLETHHFILLPPDTPYRFWADDNRPWSIYWVHFEGTLAKDFLQYPVMPRAILPNNKSRLQDRLQLFEAIYDSFSMAFTREYMIHASMCLYAFLSSFLHVEAYRHCKLPDHADESFGAKVVHYMQENISSNLTLEDLAHNFRYSPSHFSALFQKETGYSPINYYIQLKIRKACEYMETSPLKLYEIAEKVGFDEPSYFTRIFTKIIGMSPSEYRRRETAFRIKGESAAQ